MKKKYTLEGLSCPNCALKIEDRIAKIKGVTFSHVDVVSSTLTLELDGTTSKSDVEKQAKKIISTIESDVVLKEKSNQYQLKKVSFFTYNHGLMIVGSLVFLIALFLSSFPYVLWLYIVAYILVGYDIVFKAINNMINLQWFDEHFLMSIATIGAFAIGEYPEAIAVMLFYKVGEYFQERSVAHSKASIQQLLEIAPSYAMLVKGDLLVKVNPENVSIDDVVYIKAGDNIPVDGIIIEGQTSLDTSSLTGESLPNDVSVGDLVYAGTLNLLSPIKISVSKTYDQSALAKMLELIENASLKKSKSEKFITKFAKIYTPIVVMMAILLVFVPVVLFSGTFETWLYRALVFLVISCPCALVISIPLSFFGGIGAASKNGILIKGSQYLETLNDVDTIIFDKTGTLTKGEFNVQMVKTFSTYSKSEVLEMAAIVENHSNHPIAQSIVKAYNKPILNQNIQIHELAGVGLKATLDGNQILVGNESLLKKHDIDVPSSINFNTSVFVAVNSTCVGEIVVRDQLKDDAESAVHQLRKLNIPHLIILSGDKQFIVDQIQAKLALNQGYGNLLPHQKVEMVQEIIDKKTNNKKVAFVGDGINDAASLANVDVGIAMGGLGSDIAIEAADIILVNDEPSKIAKAIEIAQKTRKIVLQNITLAIGVKVFFLFFGALGVASLWEAVFADVGVALLAVFNAMRILK